MLTFEVRSGRGILSSASYGTSSIGHRRVGGRPTKNTAELREKLALLIRKGNRPVTAARVLGIADSTHYDLMRRGAVEEEGDCREYFATVKEAEAAYEIQVVARLNGFLPDNFAAVRFTLLQLGWGKEPPLESGQAEPAPKLYWENLTDAEIARLEEILEKAARKPGL